MGKRKLRTGEHPYSKYKKGFTLPGYNYLGPFNGEDNGKATGHSDKAAQEHDQEYKTSIKQHGSVKTYLRFNTADERFINKITNDKDWGARIAKRVFENKRKANAELGFTTPLRLTNGAKGISPNPNKRTKLSLSNLLASETTSMSEGSGNDGKGSGNNGSLSETPIDDVWDVHRGPPDYTFAALPFLQQEHWGTSASVVDHTFRLTSPYDIRPSYTSVDLNTSSGVSSHSVAALDGADTKVNGDSARWWDLYAGMYDFYHVVSCRWKITIENLTGDMIWVHQMYHNDEIQPPQATNEDMLAWPDIKSHLLGSHYAAITAAGRVEGEDAPMGVNAESISTSGLNYETSNHVTRRGGASPLCIMSGQYTPGDYKRAIHLDDQVENWTATTANPKLPERLTFRIKPYNEYTVSSSVATTDRLLAYRYQLSLDYLVEFKQLKTGLRYPVQRQPLTVTIAQTVATSN